MSADDSWISESDLGPVGVEHAPRSVWAPFSGVPIIPQSPAAFILLHSPDGRPMVLPTAGLIATASGHMDGLPSDFRVGARRYMRTGDGWVVRSQVDPIVPETADIDAIRVANMRAKNESAATTKATPAELEQAIASWEQAGGVRSPAGSRINWLGQTTSNMTLEPPDVVYSRLMGGAVIA